MKITKEVLKQIIKEELNEASPSDEERRAAALAKSATGLVELKRKQDMDHIEKLVIATLNKRSMISGAPKMLWSREGMQKFLIDLAKRAGESDPLGGGLV